MTHHSIELPEATYQALLMHAARLQVSPERMLERLVMGDLALPPVWQPAERDPDIPPIETLTALAAVERLTHLFADVVVINFEQHLTDPMLALANRDIETLLP